MELVAYKHLRHKRFIQTTRKDRIILMAQRPRVVTLCPVSSATTLILCAVSLTTVCLSFSLLLIQSRQINELRTEHMALKSQVTKSDITELAARCGVGE